MLSVTRTVVEKNLGENELTLNYFDIIRRMKIHNKPFVLLDKNECKKKEYIIKNDVVYYFGQMDELKNKF
jgi:hypothetical protein